MRFLVLVVARCWEQDPWVRSLLTAAWSVPSDGLAIQRRLTTQEEVRVLREKLSRSRFATVPTDSHRPSTVREPRGYHLFPTMVGSRIHPSRDPGALLR